MSAHLCCHVVHALIVIRLSCCTKAFLQCSAEADAAHGKPQKKRAKQGSCVPALCPAANTEVRCVATRSQHLRSSQLHAPAESLISHLPPCGVLTAHWHLYPLEQSTRGRAAATCTSSGSAWANAMARAPLPDPRSAQGPSGGLQLLLSACMDDCVISLDCGKQRNIGGWVSWLGQCFAESPSDMADMGTKKAHLLSKLDQQLGLWPRNEHSWPYCENQVSPVRRPCEVLQGYPAWRPWVSLARPVDGS